MFICLSFFFCLSLVVHVGLSSISAVSGGSLCFSGEKCFMSNGPNNKTASAAQTQDRLNPTQLPVSQ